MHLEIQTVCPEILGGSQRLGLREVRGKRSSLVSQPQTSAMLQHCTAGGPGKPLASRSLASRVSLSSTLRLTTSGTLLCSLNSSLKPPSFCMGSWDGPLSFSLAYGREGTDAGEVGSGWGMAGMGWGCVETQEGHRDLKPE